MVSKLLSYGLHGTFLLLVISNLPRTQCTAAGRSFLLSSNSLKLETSTQNALKPMVEDQSEMFPSFVPLLEESNGRNLRKPPPLNTQPLIGILSQPGDGDGGLAPRLSRECRRWKGSTCSKEEVQKLITQHENQNSEILKKHSKGDDDMSYIAASYIKWVESAGARAVPIFYDEPMEERERKFRAVNGLIIPGGGTDLEPGPFMEAVSHLLDLAAAANDAGDYFPVQGTCMGLEALTIYVSQNYSILELRRFISEDDPSTLKFSSANAMKEGMFAWMSPGLLQHVQSQGLTMENHADGTTVERFSSDPRLTSFFNILTTSFDKNGTEYVSTVVGKQYPFYGTQWHPEKNAFEWGLEHIPHSAAAVAVCQAAANFFINEARRSTYAPASEEDLDDMLIYNFDPVFAGRHGKGFFEQSYVFRKDGNTPAPGGTTQ